MSVFRGPSAGPALQGQAPILAIGMTLESKKGEVTIKGSLSPCFASCLQAGLPLAKHFSPSSNDALLLLLLSRDDSFLTAFRNLMKAFSIFYKFILQII